MTEMRDSEEWKNWTISPELAEKINSSFDKAQKAMSDNLSRSMYAQYDWMPALPQPWHIHKIKLLRRRLGEKIADFASWVAGYDVRGDW